MICNHEEFIKKSQMLCTKIEKSKFLNLLSISNEEAWPNKEIDILEVLYLFIFYYEFENSENANINNPLVLNIIVKALQRMPRCKKNFIGDFACYFVSLINQFSKRKYALL